MIDLKGQTVLITGSTDGLGKLLAKNLVEQGCNIIVHGRNEEKTQQTVFELQNINKEIKVESVVCDLNQPQEILQAFSNITGLDILVNNAGIFTEGNTVDMPVEQVIEMVNVNLLASILVTRLLLPVLQKSSFAQILFVSSVAGVELPFGYFHTVYSATKFGMQGFAEALTKEFYDSNIRVMGFYPGGMETKIFEKAKLDYAKHEPWMFDPQESVDAMIFMLTRSKKVNLKRLDLFNHLEK